jgi:predicted cupin superfamily sugar epimerase
MDAQSIIQKLCLAPHPEGGFFRETYRSAESIPERDRSISTAIYFLLTGDDYSSFHRLRSDEIWHYYAGDPVRLHMIHTDGEHQQVLVGPDVLNGQQPQAIIPQGSWFAARVEKSDGYILIGCTVAPGFDFSDFELAKRDELARLFPAHKQLIHAFTR